jgi:hypothetical protein
VLQKVASTRRSEWTPSLRLTGVQEVQRDDGEGVGLLADGPDGGMEGTVVELNATDLVTRPKRAKCIREKLRF